MCDDISEGREYDEVAGVRLPKQRPHSIEKKDEAGTQEIERTSTTSSSMKTRRQGVSALIEHMRQDDWTYTSCICGGSGCSGGCDVLAGERLPKQRKQDEEHLDHNIEDHFGARFPHQGEEAVSIVFHSSSNTCEIKNDNHEARATASAAAK